MKKKALILLHEESLRMSHPVFNEAPIGTQVIYIWDDAYLQRNEYSLKRLIFIYETLSAMDLEIYQGDTHQILQEMNPSMLYIPSTSHPLLIEMIHLIHQVLPVSMVADEPFVQLDKTQEFKRFFQYWNQAQKSAFLYHGGDDA